MTVFQRKLLEGFSATSWSFPVSLLRERIIFPLVDDEAIFCQCEDRYSRDSRTQQTKCVNIGVYASGTMTYFSLFCFQYFFLVCYCLLTITSNRIGTSWRLLLYQKIFNPISEVNLSQKELCGSLLSKWKTSSKTVPSYEKI